MKYFLTTSDLAHAPLEEGLAKMQTGDSSLLFPSSLFAPVSFLFFFLHFLLFLLFFLLFFLLSLLHLLLLLLLSLILLVSPFSQAT